MLRLSRVSRENQSTILSFNSQRLLFSFASKLIHSGEYHSFVDETRTSYTSERIEWTRDIYELARWQSHQSNSGIDLALECEWVSNVFGLFTKPHYSGSRDGTLDALRLYIDILNIIARDHPEKIITHYKNISNNIPSAHFPNLNKENYSPQSFFYDFYSYEHTFHDSKNIREKLTEILDWNKRTPMNTPKEGLNSLEQKIDYEYLYRVAFNRELHITAAHYIATLAYHNRYNELTNCINWKKPENSTVHYIGEVLLPSSIGELAGQIFSCESRNIETMNFERHDPEVILYRGYAAILAYFISRDETLSYDFFVSISKYSKIKHSAEMLLIALKFLRKKDFFDENHIEISIDLITHSLENAKTREHQRVLKSKISLNLVATCKNVITGRWRDITQPDISKRIRKKFNLFESFQVRYTNEVQTQLANILYQNLDKNYFIDEKNGISNIEIFSEAAFANFHLIAIDHIKREAKACNEKPIFISKETLLFCDRDTLISLNFECASESTGYWRSRTVEGAEAIETDCNTLRVFQKDKYEIVLTRNVSIDGENPLFVTFTDIGNTIVQLNIGLYYSIRELPRPLLL